MGSSCGDKAVGVPLRHVSTRLDVPMVPTATTIEEFKAVLMAPASSTDEDDEVKQPPRNDDGEVKSAPSTFEGDSLQPRNDDEDIEPTPLIQPEDPVPDLVLQPSGSDAEDKTDSTFSSPSEEVAIHPRTDNEAEPGNEVVGEPDEVEAGNEVVGEPDEVEADSEVVAESAPQAPRRESVFVDGTEDLFGDPDADLDVQDDSDDEPAEPGAVDDDDDDDIAGDA
ncbi:hypothetical protein M885DRAFT_616887 [Pelagophyceae sp. CCMP2097]|nr:hypothetical protein M885DRAFT_616887 [Pelagophyceae sp. CCMP2097]